MWKRVIGMCVGLGICTFAQAAPFPEGTIVDKIEDDTKDERTEAEKRREERLKKINEAHAKIGARVMVLQWPQSDLDHKDPLLQRNLRARISRPNARFYPDMDLYQAGRREMDDTIRPLDQRAVVPDTAIEHVMAAVNELSEFPWNALDDEEWGLRAYELKQLVEEQIWFVDRPELRVALFRAHVEIGNAANNSNNPLPPFFAEVSGVSINYYTYLAAAMAVREPALMSHLTEPTRHDEVAHLKEKLEQGAFDPMVLHFDVSGEFDKRAFASDYTLLINGLEHTITNDEALVNLPPGVADVYLQRDDGHGMAVKVEEVRIDDEQVYGVRDQARKRMGLQFITQLLRDPNQCQPELDGQIINYLAIYQKLHPGTEIYIAVPRDGSIHDVLLWKWLEDKGRLVRIDDNSGGFPVRFVALAGAGLTYSGLSVASVQPDPTQPKLSNLAEDALKPTLSSVPIAFELRGHTGRLMVGVQLDFAFSAQGKGWAETPASGHRDHVVTLENTEYAVSSVEGQDTVHRIQTTNSGDPAVTMVPHTKTRTFQRGLFVNAAYVLGRDAAYGFGPRLGMRSGVYNAPRSVDLTAHLGWAFKPPIRERAKPDSRIWPIVDLDAFGGMALPIRDSLLLLTAQHDGNVMKDSTGTLWAPVAQGSPDQACVDDTGCKDRKIGNPIPAFGFAAKVGITF